MVDVRNIGDVWWAFDTGDVGLRSLYVPLSTEIKKNALRKDGWQFEPCISESWKCARINIEYGISDPNILNIKKCSQRVGPRKPTILLSSRHSGSPGC